MLFNPLWREPEVKADPLSLDTLIAWLKENDRNERYVYLSCDRCLLALYFNDHGYEKVLMAREYFHSSGNVVTRLPPLFNWIAESSPQSYRGALRRAIFIKENPKAAERIEKVGPNYGEVWAGMRELYDEQNWRSRRIPARGEVLVSLLGTT